MIRIKLTYLVFLMLVSISWNMALASAKSHSSLIDKSTQRIITTDWSIAETLLILDAPLVGVGDAIQYKNWVANPVIHDGIIDLGLRTQPNLEALMNADANTLINSSWFLQILPPELIEHRYTLHAVDYFTNDGISWQNTVAQTELLGKITNRQAQAKRLIEQVDITMQTDRLQIEQFAKRPIALVQFIDSRHLRIYGNNSLYGVVLDKLKMHNAWQKATNSWGFEQITLLDLANLPATTLLIIIAPYPANLADKLASNQLWQHLPFANNDNYRVIPAVWAFGALPSMQRFSNLFSDSLLNPTQYHWSK